MAVAALLFALGEALSPTRRLFVAPTWLEACSAVRRGAPLIRLRPRLLS